MAKRDTNFLETPIPEERQEKSRKNDKRQNKQLQKIARIWKIQHIWSSTNKYKLLDLSKSRND
ncbi:hypothetical protein HYE34_01560 [Mycoplasmopsis bovis]|nr:hypothetical protein HYE34_01560 [Mycoplasmopsis bovis]